MPIRFRCSYCNRLLGIATRKAGMETTCPHCGYTITVPQPQAQAPAAVESESDGRTERLNLDDVDEMLGTTAAETSAKAAVAEAPAPAAAPLSLPPSPPPAPRPTAPAASSPPPPPVQKAKPAAPPAPKKPAPVSTSTNPDDRPLFEGDVDEILGAPAEADEQEREKKPAVTGMDAMSLSEPTRQIVISGPKATLLMILVVVLMAISFAAGMFLAPHR